VKRHAIWCADHYTSMLGFRPASSNSSALESGRVLDVCQRLLSCLVLSCLVSSRLVLSCLVLSCLVSSRLVTVGLCYALFPHPRCTTASAAVSCFVIVEALLWADLPSKGYYRSRCPMLSLWTR
jgi:hypothetical protein